MIHAYSLSGMAAICLEGIKMAGWYIGKFSFSSF
jgi:hypothetical protein